MWHTCSHQGEVHIVLEAVRVTNADGDVCYGSGDQRVNVGKIQYCSQVLVLGTLFGC